MAKHEGLGIKSIGKSEFYSNLENKAHDKRIPLEAMIELTYGCNMRCVHCYNPTHEAKGELTTEEFYRIIDQLVNEGCFTITFTGGEMFTRRDVFDIFTYAKQKGFAVILFTNATMITAERADRIQALEPWRVEVSIYGATQETYERVTQIPGSFRLFLRGVELLRERKVPLFIKMPVMTLNQHEAKEAKALVEGWGIKFTYCTEIDPRQDGSLDPLRYRITPQDVLKIDQEILGEQPLEEREEKSCQAPKGLFQCKCGKSSLAITPYGEMNLCINFPVPRYNLRAGNVSSGWKALVDYVDSARPNDSYECPSCNLEPHCRQGPVDAWRRTGDLSPCLPYYQELAGLEKEAHEKTSKLHLAHLFVYPSSPEEMMTATTSGLKERQTHFVEKYKELLHETGFLSRLDCTLIRESPPALFELVHSSFEYAVYLLHRLKKRHSWTWEFLTEQIDAIIDRATQAADQKNGIPRPHHIYEVTGGKPRIDFFPDPFTYRLLKQGSEDVRFYRLIEAAKKWIENWKPGLVTEIDFFIRDYTLFDGDLSRLYYRSVDDEPGFIMIALRRLMAEEGQRYEPDSEIGTILMAAQLIHESRHQKGFYFNRVTDPRPLRYPTGFIKPHRQRTQRQAVFRTFGLWELFDLMLSVGYEIAFLKFVKKNVSLGPYTDPFEKRLTRKKAYFFSLLASAEQERKALTPLGIVTLDELLHFLES